MSDHIQYSGLPTNSQMLRTYQKMANVQSVLYYIIIHTSRIQSERLYPDFPSRRSSKPLNMVNELCNTQWKKLCCLYIYARVELSYETSTKKKKPSEEIPSF